MWVAKDYFNILGTSFAVLSTDREYAELVRTVWHPFLLDHSTGVPARRTYGLVRSEADAKVNAYRDCRRLGTPSDLGAGLLKLVAHTNRTAIEQCGEFAVHAGVVSMGDAAVAFPTNSGGGKSTLTTACLLAGFAYVSDEALCIQTGSDLVLPYPKPISLSEHSLRLLNIAPDDVTVPVSGKEGLLVPDRDLGVEVVSTPLRLMHVVLPRFGESEYSLAELPASEAMTALLELSFNHYKFGEGAFRLAARLASTVRVWALSYNDPRSAAIHLKDVLA